MKKALMLSGVVLCTTASFASKNQSDIANEGKRKNEAAYERSLEQTGWKNESSTPQQKTDAKGEKSLSQSVELKNS